MIDFIVMVVGGIISSFAVALFFRIYDRVHKNNRHE